jgi:hypothetical protein
MKRLDLVQLIIIIVGIFSGFYFITAIPQFLFFLYSWFSDGLRGGYLLETFFENTILLFSYLAAAFYCIKRSKYFAEWICSNGQLNAEINFSLNKTELLFVLFIGLGVYGLIKNLPFLLSRGFNYIRSKNSFDGAIGFSKDTGENILIQFIIVFLFFILVYYAKVFADFFAAKINNIEPEDAIAEEN